MVLIQDSEIGLPLFEYRGPAVRFDQAHEELFSGFLSAVQCITTELNIGALTQLSTDSHHCLIHQKNRIRVVIIINEHERVGHWRRKARKICRDFVNRFLNAQYNPNNTGYFSQFAALLEKSLKLPRISER